MFKHGDRVDKIELPNIKAVGSSLMNWEPILLCKRHGGPIEFNSFKLFVRIAPDELSQKQTRTCSDFQATVCVAPAMFAHGRNNPFAEQGATRYRALGRVENIFGGLLA